MTFLQRGKLVTLGAGAAVLVGCGGGGGSNSGAGAGTGPSQITSVGQGAVTFIGQPKPKVSASSGSVTVSGLAGAVFTAVNVSQAPVLNNTYFAYSRYVEGATQIYTLPYSGGSETLLTRSVPGSSGPALSKTGYISYYQEVNYNSYIMRADGSSNRAATFSGPPNFIVGQSVSPYANYIAFEAAADQLWYAPLGGGTGTLIQTDDGGYGTAWEPDNKTIIYTAYDSNNNLDLYSTPITGGTPTNVTPTALRTTGYWQQPACSSDGVTIAGVYTPSKSNLNQIILFSSINPYDFVLTPPAYSDTYPTFSPDGTQIAFYRSSTGGATPGIYISDVSGENQHLVFADPSGAGAVSNLNWSPYPYNQLMLGASSNLYNANVDGFLLSQNGSQFGGVCGFTTTTASTATVTAPTTVTGSSPLVFTLSGDNITMLEYTNSFYDLHGETLIQPSTNTPAALVTVDATTGGIDTVATAASTFASSSAKTAGGTLTYSGKFTAIYNKTGKNLAPSGAKQIVVNPTTGKLVSFQ